MTFGRPMYAGISSKPIVRATAVVAILAILLFSSLAASSSAVAGRHASPHSGLGTATTGTGVTFTGDPATDFPSDALLYTNWFTPWGVGYNNLTGLYGTWDSTNLFLAVSGIQLSGNQMLFTVSNGTPGWGSTNLSDLSGAGAGMWNRSIDFTQPVNFLFVVNTTGVLFGYQVTSKPGSAQTNVTAISLAGDDDSVTYDGATEISSGSLEVNLSFATIYPAGIPKFANVSLYAGIFGGSDGYVGPTIPSGQSYDVTYEGHVQLTSHDRPGGYVLENTFYTLGLDPNGLGVAESGLDPSYISGDAFHTVTFTGDLGSDFAPGELALTNPNTMWGGTNLLNSEYETWNETTLFLGFNASIENNNLYFFLGNNTNSGQGTFSGNFTNDVWLNHPFVFSQPVNFIGYVHYSGTGVPGSVDLYEVTSGLATSNTSVTVTNVTSELSASLTSTTAVELAVPFSVLYDRPGSWPVLGQYANTSVLAVISDTGVGSSSTGPTLPAGQGYAYGGYYNTNHTDGYFELLNTFFNLNLDPYGDGVPAGQVNPTYTYGQTYHSVKFTGTPTSDFDPLEIVGTGNYTGWSSSNLLNSIYLTWNFSTLFVGTNSTVGGGNNLLVAISNGTGVGATNFTVTNVPNLQRNFVFATPVDFVLYYEGGSPNASLYEVDLSGTTSSQTTFTFLANFTAGTDGEEFAIPISTLYPNQPTVAGADAIPPGASVDTVGLIYGGPGAYIGPTIPNGQQSSTGTGFAHINAFTTTGLDPNKNGYAEPGIVPSTPAVSYSGAPISLNIVFNDHQPLYESIGGSELLPWTEVHLEEYAEQALLAGEFPGVNITYSLSGSLLYQIDAIAHGDFNNSYLEAAWIPASQWGNSVYTEVTTYDDTFLGSFVAPYQWNTTTVANLLEYDLAFNTPPWVYTAPTAASTTYDALFHLYQNDTTLSDAQLTNALVEFFLWAASEPIITGQLGGAYINSTMWTFYNDTSFSISDLRTIQGYYPVEAALVLSAFSHDRMLNDGSGGNVELITTPFDHPILPLLLLNNWTDENGDTVTKGVWANDTTAQLQIGSQLYQQIFGQAPLGLWTPEEAVSEAMLPYVNDTGYEWTSSSEADLGLAGISVPGTVATAQEMENLYTPYRVGNSAAGPAIVFRDDTLSNDWGFNYGSVASTSGNWAAVKDFIGYLKNVYATVPRPDHAATLVTMALDGENWMFMSPFPEDGVPFLEDVYTALVQNDSWLHTTTTQQYLASSPTLPVLASLPTGSWNNEPSGSGINSYLGQWAGHGLQDALWQQLTLVRSEVQAYGTANSLSQPETLATLEQYNYFPYINEWNTSTGEGKYVEAWTAIYGAEGSDLYFALDPDDQSPTAQNALVFEQEFRSDLSLALTVLGLPLTPFLESSYVAPETPTTWGTNASVTPLLDGTLYTTQTFAGGTGYSVNNNDAWAGAYVESTGDTTSGSAEIASTTYAFDVSNLYFSVAVNGPTSAYRSPNFYTAAQDDINLYFSPVNPQPGDVQSLNVPDAVYTAGSVPFGFAATSEATIEGNSITPSGSATLGVFGSAAGGTWTSITSVVGDAFVGGLLQLQVPMTDVGMVPGDSITFFVAVVNGTTGDPVSWSGPLTIAVPSALAKLTLVSTIHNTALDNGPGDYTYPTYTEAFPPNSFDMEWFNVSTNPYTVEFNITFGNLSNIYDGGNGFSQPIVDIFIHQDGQSGQISGGYAGPDIDIAPNSAWSYVIQASGYPSWDYVENTAGDRNPAQVVVTTNLGEPGTSDVVKSNQNVSIEVPASLIGSGLSSDTFVIVAGSQDGEGNLINGWRVVTPSNSTYQGGGAEFTDSPNVYSYISPAMVGSNPMLTQQDLLSNYSDTQNATLVGISLPLLHVTTAKIAKLGASAFANASGDPDAYYAVGSQVYSSSSAAGMTWATPTPLVNLSFVPTGMAANGGAWPALLAWNGSSYVFEDLTDHAFTNGSASGAIEAGSVTYASGSYLVALDVGGTVTVGPPGAAAWGTFTLGALAVALSNDSAGTDLAYATTTTVSVVGLGIAASSVTFGTTTVLTAAVPSGATPESLSLAAAPNGAVAVALAAENSTGSNIYLAVGSGTVTFTALTTDGADSSPTVILGYSNGEYQAYIGFTNSAGSGNVYFLPSPVATVTPTVTPSKPSSSSSTPWWVWLIIAVVVILVIVAVLAAVMRKPKQPSASTSAGSTEADGSSAGTGGETPAGEESTSSGPTASPAGENG